MVAGIIQNYEIKPRVLVYSQSKLTRVLLCKASSNVALETIQAYNEKPLLYARRARARALLPRHYLKILINNATRANIRTKNAKNVTVNSNKLH